MHIPIPQKGKVISKKLKDFKREKAKVKAEIPLHIVCDIKSWSGPLAKPLVSSALQTLTLLAHISSAWWMILKFQVCALS